MLVGENSLVSGVDENTNRAVRLQQPASSNFPASISAGGSPQNPALFSRTTFQPVNTNVATFIMFTCLREKILKAPLQLQIVNKNLSAFGTS